MFYNLTPDKIELNRTGHEALLGQRNFSLEIDSNMKFGGVSKRDFQFNKTENKLVKSKLNAH